MTLDEDRPGRDLDGRTEGRSDTEPSTPALSPEERRAFEEAARHFDEAVEDYETTETAEEPDDRPATDNGTPTPLEAYKGREAAYRPALDDTDPYQGDDIADTGDAYYDERALARAERRREKRYRKVKKSIRKHVSGKPTMPKYARTHVGVVLHGLSVAVKAVLVGIVAVIFLVGGIGLGALVGYISETEPVSAEMLGGFDQTSYLYDNENNLMAIQTGSHNINRTVISFSEVRNTYLDDAFIAVEDQRFETNIGIDPKRIASATLSAVLNRGQATHGGSTITQQTVKMLTGQDDISISRKVQEWYSAVRLNEQLSKWEIMELYLNLVPMANSYVGVQAGAQAYFGKDAADLNLAESAFLAGIPKSPVAYNPLREDGKRNALRRQRMILGMMRDQGKISEEEYQAALNYELVFRQTPLDFSGTDIQSYFTEYAIRETVRGLMKHKGYSESYARQLVASGGVSIYTTMEPTAQEALDATYQKLELFQRDPSLYIDLPEQPEAGTVILNNQTGAIAAMQGGFGDKPGNLVVNRATDIRRSPGSALKPNGVYAPGIEMGIVSGATIIRDEPAHLDPARPDVVWPYNTYDEFRGDMTLRNAVKISNNVPAAKVLAEVGVENAKYYLRRVGIDLTDDPVGMAISVGTLSEGLSPLQVASAFSVFPNGGLYSKPYAVKQVLDHRNNIIFENKPSFDQVFTAETAFQMNKILEEVVQRKTSAFWYPGSAWEHGYIENAAGDHIDTAGKTGTTDLDRDKWMALYTPYYTAATWYGFDNNIRTTFVKDTDMWSAIDITYDAMDPLHADLPGRTWNRPASIIELMVCIDSGQLATADCQTNSVHTTRAMKEYFVAGSDLVPTEVCPVHGGSHAPINRIAMDQEALREEDLAAGYGTDEPPENPGIAMAGEPDYDEAADEAKFRREEELAEAARREQEQNSED